MELNDCLKKVWWDLINKHREYARDKRDVEREIVFRMLDDLEAIYPQLKAEWNELERQQDEQA